MGEETGRAGLVEAALKGLETINVCISCVDQKVSYEQN